jgi:chemotaxis protein MotA
MAFLVEIMRFFDPLSLLIVFGGSALAAAARSTRADISRALSALGPLFSAKPELDAHAALVAVNRIEKLAEVRSIACADRVRTAELFLRRAARRLSDAASADSFAYWSREELDQRARRHAGAIAFWRAGADAAPAMGMIGTIIGLIQMFAAMDDAARIGPAMALALLTTLYGVILSSALAGPIAERLQRLSDVEIAWQRSALERLERIARAELDTQPVRPRANLRSVP